mmetsp:Transcript_34720/g.56236  ORF Transcript_34720/g.56236 Transcript_34720/m.56236 type:complete len:281 (+) Transcript_34720:50-892(+)
MFHAFISVPAPTSLLQRQSYAKGSLSIGPSCSTFRPAPSFTRLGLTPSAHRSFSNRIRFVSTISRVTSAVSTPVAPSNSSNNIQEYDDSIPRSTDPYVGISSQRFPKEAEDVLVAPLPPLDVEIKPDGMLYLPEIKYRRILLTAFGPGGWGLIPRQEPQVEPSATNDKAMNLYREFALYCMGRFVSQAMGEMTFYPASMSYATAMEGAKSNALVRCCKDLGIASHLWDPSFILAWREEYAVEVWAEHFSTKQKKRIWRRKDRARLESPYRETGFVKPNLS